MNVFSTARRSTAAFALTVGGVLALGGCATAASTSGGDAAPADADGPVKIGYLGPLTGGTASLGVPMLHGFELAVAELNASGTLDREIELIAVDDEADASKSAAAAQRMVTEDGVTAVIGGPISGTVLATNPIITGAGVVNLISVAQVDTLVDPEKDGYDLTFRLTENNSYDIDATVGLFEQGGYESICAVADTSEYGQGGIASIEAVFAERGLAVANKVDHEPNATDLTPQVLTLRDADCDAVYLFDYGADAALFMKTVNQVGWDVPVIGGRALNQAAFLSIAGDAGDGLIFPSVIDPEKPAAQEFIDAFDAEYGADEDPAHTFSGLAYDTMVMLATALQASGFEGGEALASALESTEIEGVTGLEGSTLGFSPESHEAPSADYVTFFTIENGEYQLYSRDVVSGR